MNGATVSRRLNSLKQCFTYKLCSLFLPVDVLIIYKTCACTKHCFHPPPRLGMSSEEKLIINDLKLGQNSTKFIVFSLTRETYTNMRTDIQCTPTPSPKLFSILSPTPLRKLYQLDLQLQLNFLRTPCLIDMT